MNMPTAMTRIAIVTTHPIQYHAPLFARMAKQSGWLPMVFYTWSQSEAGNTYDPDFKRNISWDIPLLEGYPHRFVPNRSPRPGSDHFRGIQNPTLIQEISAWKPDVLIVFGWAFRSHLACLMHFSGKIPIFFRGDSTLLDERPGMKRMLRRLFLSWVYRHIDVGLCVGQNNQAYYLAHGLHPTQLVRAPHAIDNDRFASDDERRTAAAMERRRALGIADKDVVLLFVGKLEPKKDPGFLIRLARRLPEKPYRFLFVGNGQLSPSLQQEAAGDPRIQFLGFQNQQAMPEIYRMADLLVLPSLWNETWGLAVNEAMACGRPVLVSDRVGCAADLVVQGETGWVFSTQADGVSQACEWLLAVQSVQGRLKAMGQIARVKVGEYSIDQLLEGISTGIHQMSGRKSNIQKSA